MSLHLGTCNVFTKQKSKEQSGSARLDCSWVFCIFVGVPIEAGSGLNHCRHCFAFVVIHIVARCAGIIGLDLPLLDCICCHWALHAPLLGCICHHCVGFTIIGLYLPSLGCDCCHWVLDSCICCHWHPLASLGLIHHRWGQFTVIGLYSPWLVG